MRLVKAKFKQEDEWTPYPTRTLEDIDRSHASLPPIEYSRYGGWANSGFRQEATGYFYPAFLNGRWWLIDPEGHPFIHVGVVSVSPGGTAVSRAALENKFGDLQGWADATSGWLGGLGFNGVGAWSRVDLLRQTPHRLVYTQIWNFMSSFGYSKGLSYQGVGQTGYIDGCIPVFHPEFPEYCRQLARKLEETKDDPYLLGHFSDNELPCSHNQLDRFLKLDPDHPEMGHGFRAAWQWLQDRKGTNATLDDVTEEDREAFLGFLFDAYFSITSQAIREADPNHLCLGSRFHAYEKHSRAAWEAAGRHLDVVGINLYKAWDPSPVEMKSWQDWAQKPFMITEWYAKGADSGFPNHSGWGWTVETQADRGLFYHNFVLGLLESGGCVGWHWFMYMDNDPDNHRADPSNRDANKGMVTRTYDSYEPLVDRMKELNEAVYPLLMFMHPSSKAAT